ncbi:cuticle protein 7-like [Amphibalanus amphitrite]|uniref:cuticle protein 7-like n=1 Tax=Amphibalanus amphitrite TaxID=1232801 RepID=UPI001C90B435|nr:cuticle protein 7-like [Amphibalanus amphitrite]
MKVLIVCALIAAARAGYYSAGPVGARFSYGYTAVNPVHGYAPAATYAAAPYAAATYAAPYAAATYAAAPYAAATYAAAPYAAATYAAAPYAAATYAAAPYAAVPASASSQHHSQDELGQYNYGYADVNSAKNEVKTADGVVRGSYSYVDSYGIPQKVSYVSDALGFRVAGTNLPVGPSAVLAGPAPVADTPEVAAAKSAHFAAHSRGAGPRRRALSSVSRRQRQ